jgi:hypothetical protein
MKPHVIFNQILTFIHIFKAIPSNPFKNILIQEKSKKKKKIDKRVCEREKGD